MAPCAVLYFFYFILEKTVENNLNEYQQLLIEAQPRVIYDDKDCEATMEKIDALLAKKDLTDAEYDLLELLQNLVVDFEEESELPLDDTAKLLLAMSDRQRQASPMEYFCTFLFFCGLVGAGLMLINIDKLNVILEPVRVIRQQP
jgi:hypothetical protein